MSAHDPDDARSLIRNATETDVMHDGTPVATYTPSSVLYDDAVAGGVGIGMSEEETKDTMERLLQGVILAIANGELVPVEDPTDPSLPPQFDRAQLAALLHRLDAEATEAALEAQRSSKGDPEESDDDR